MKILKSAPQLCLLFVLCLGLACTRRSGNSVAERPQTPEETVKSFVELSASARDTGDKRKIQELCQGELRRTFERMTDEGFKLLYLDSKIKINELKIVEASTSGDTARVHYSLHIQNGQGTDPTDEINEREVDLVRVQGGWFIESIRIQGNDRVAFTRGMIF